jgi:hypothetical protein
MFNTDLFQAFAADLKEAMAAKEEAHSDSIYKAHPELAEVMASLPAKETLSQDDIILLRNVSRENLMASKEIQEKLDEQTRKLDSQQEILAEIQLNLVGLGRDMQQCRAIELASLIRTHRNVIVFRKSLASFENPILKCLHFMFSIGCQYCRTYVVPNDAKSCSIAFGWLFKFIDVFHAITNEIPAFHPTSPSFRIVVPININSSIHRNYATTIIIIIIILVLSATLYTTIKH